MPEHPATLRDLAEWYCDLAEVGRADQGEVRLKMAEHLDRRAKQPRGKHPLAKIPTEPGDNSVEGDRSVGLPGSKYGGIKVTNGIA